ncbi:MAG: translation elongation factor 4, partial [Anaerolineae bacterium]
VRAPKPAAPPRMHLVAAGVAFDPLEVGVFAPDLKPCLGLSAGDVGYVATGLKTVRQVRVGDTLALAEGESVTALPGYNAAKPMVFAGVYPIVSDDYEDLRDALDKLRLNDAALSVEPESSVALGHGFRVGFLGLFHMEIVQERLEREYGLNLLTTAPSVVYEIALRGGGTISVDNPAAFPDPSTIEEIREPWMLVTIWSPDEYIGPIMDLVTSRRGVFDKMEYVAPSRVMITYHMPLADIITEFYDHLKSRTRGYASMDYHLDGLRAGDLVRVDILVNDTPVDALSLISHAEDAHRVGDAMTRRLKSVIPRQQFKVPIQAAIGRRIIARQTVAAMRKDVLAKCYGGDVSRKRKLLEQQRAGKKRMKRMGNVEIPQEAFMAVLKLGGDGKTK